MKLGWFGRGLMGLAARPPGGAGVWPPAGCCAAGGGAGAAGPPCGAASAKALARSTVVPTRSTYDLRIDLSPNLSDERCSYEPARFGTTTHCRLRTVVFGWSTFTLRRRS